MPFSGFHKPGAQPLLASYGGGHAQIISKLSLGLIERGMQPNILGFTTAFQFFRRSGLDAKSVKTIFDTDTDRYGRYFADVRPYFPVEQHPDISEEETLAYFSIGFSDLVETHGFGSALNMLRREGRSAFRPVLAMERFLRHLQPSCVITTTSPRFELALLQAARRMGIPSLAVSDLFLINERKWILAGGYAEHLTVISETMKEELLKEDLRGTKIAVTGNPVFDELAPKPDEKKTRDKLREKLGVTGRKVILWPSAPITKSSQYETPFSTPTQVSIAFEKLCLHDSSYIYMLRPHPNAPYKLPAVAVNGILDPGLSPEDAILVADIVCVEISTMGLQAALRGLPVICVGFADKAVYPRYGLANSVDTLGDAVTLISDKSYKTPQSRGFGMPPLGTSTELILDLIVKL